MKNAFALIGIYSFISTSWRAYEQVRYGKIAPRNEDTVIAMIFAILIYLMIV